MLSQQRPVCCEFVRLSGPMSTLRTERNTVKRTTSAEDNLLKKVACPSESKMHYCIRLLPNGARNKQYSTPRHPISLFGELWGHYPTSKTPFKILHRRGHNQLLHTKHRELPGKGLLCICAPPSHARSLVVRARHTCALCCALHL